MRVQQHANATFVRLEAKVRFENFYERLANLLFSSSQNQWKIESLFHDKEDDSNTPNKDTLETLQIWKCKWTPPAG